MRRRSSFTVSWQKKSRRPFCRYLAATLNNLGILARAQNQPEEARKEYEEALKIYEGLAKQDPEQFLPHVSRVKKLLEELQR